MRPAARGTHPTQPQLINTSASQRLTPHQPPRRIKGHRATIGIMASTEALPPEYDSGEDVIEVAFPPPSSSTYQPRDAGSASAQQPQPPPLQLPSQQPQHRSRLQSSASPQLLTPPHSFRERLAEAAREAERAWAEEEQRASRSGTESNRPLHRHRHHHHHRRHSRGSQQDRVTVNLDSPPRSRAQPSTGSAIIDLTEEPDSPPRDSRSERHSQTQGHAHRHPRRTNSQRVSPPSLERTDGSSSIPRSMRMSSQIIDLTVDSPDDEQPVLPFGIRPTPTWPPNHHHHHHHHHHAPPRPRPQAGDEIVRVGVVHNPGRGGMLRNIGFGTLGRRLAGYLGAEIIEYALSGHNAPIPHPESARASPKPALEEPPKARAGFTRDTNAEPENDEIVVCPCCEEELAYDPNETASSTTISPNSKKRKRSPGEHHFWALKKCGHVCNYPLPFP